MMGAVLNIILSAGAVVLAIALGLGLILFCAAFVTPPWPGE